MRDKYIDPTTLNTLRRRYNEGNTQPRTKFEEKDYAGNGNEPTKSRESTFHSQFQVSDLKLDDIKFDDE